jgi:putative flippase GtrA
MRRAWYQASVLDHDRLGPEGIRVLKFCVVGGSSTFLAIAVYGALLAFDVNYMAAGALAWGVGVVNGYTWNRLWTFDRAEHQTSLLARYVGVGLLGLGLNTGLLALLHSAAGIDELAAELVALPVVVLTTFLVNRFWVFREHVRDGVPRPVRPER